MSGLLDDDATAEVLLARRESHRATYGIRLADGSRDLAAWVERNLPGQVTFADVAAAEMPYEDALVVLTTRLLEIAPGRQELAALLAGALLRLVKEGTSS